MSEWTPEIAYAIFQEKLEIFKRFDPISNEAKTRFDIIDSILLDVLDWPRSDIDPEKWCRAEGYADYVLTIDHKIALVIEAKKSGTDFLISKTRSPSTAIPFSLLGKESPAARDALIQAQGYAAHLGAPYIAISNGHQWIFALTFVPNQRIEDRQVFAFCSPEDIDNNFRTFCDCFSMSAISENKVANKLLDSHERPAPRKLSSEIPNYPTVSNRNDYGNEIYLVLDQLWKILENTEHSEEFLRHCYIPTQENREIINCAKELLRSRHRADTRYTGNRIEDTSRVADAIRVVSSDKPFTLLGEVGRGKSSFLDYLRLFSAKNELDHYIQIQIDFKEQPDHTEEVTRFVYDEIEDILRKNFNIDIEEDKIVRGVLHNELERFRKSTRWILASGGPDKGRQEELNFFHERIADRHKYLKEVFKHLKYGQKKSIAIFFDNLDRRPGDIQDEAYRKASSIARDWECAVFLCLRPSTFHESLKRGLLDSLAPKTYTIGSPNMSLVLKRRFNYARLIALGELKGPFLEQLRSEQSIALKLPSVADIFGCCELSTKKNADAIQALTALSNSNIRELLGLTREVLTSGYLDTRKILKTIQSTGKYYVPDFEAIKTLLYGDYAEYDPRSSAFLNLFDIFHNDPKEHFIRMLILEYLSRFDENSTDDGFVSHQHLETFARSLYFSQDTFNKHLNILTRSECILALPSSDEAGISSFKYRLRSRGKFHLYIMTQNFQYYDAIIIDTPIIDATTREQMRFQADIHERLNRTQSFISYLFESVKYISDPSSSRILIDLLSKGIDNINGIREHLKESL
ncbi:MAG: hypothetical protein JW942_04660 [Opitutales bacterium]|nr:hypothetical protein [Opitutales bacterium]